MTIEELKEQWDAHYYNLFQIAANYFENAEAAEKIVQTVMVTAWKENKNKTFPGEAAFLNILVDLTRALCQAQVFGNVTPGTTHHLTEEQEQLIYSTIASIDRQIFSKVFEEMEPFSIQQRKILLFQAQNYTDAQIADLLQINPGQLQMQKENITGLFTQDPGLKKLLGKFGLDLH